LLAGDIAFISPVSAKKVPRAQSPTPATAHAAGSYCTHLLRGAMRVAMRGAMRGALRGAMKGGDAMGDAGG
jgi:hypothetical protein